MKQNNSFYILAPSFNNRLFQVNSIACFTKDNIFEVYKNGPPYFFLILPLLYFNPHSNKHILTNRNLFGNNSSSIHQIYDLTLPRLRARPCTICLINECWVGTLIRRNLLYKLIRFLNIQVSWVLGPRAESREPNCTLPSCQISARGSSRAGLFYLVPHDNKGDTWSRGGGGYI